MAVFSISSEHAQADLTAEIERIYPDRHFHWTDKVSFVRATGSALSVAASVGIQTRDPENNVRTGKTGAIVLQLAPSYYGWTNAALWEWLKVAFEAGD